MSASIASRHHQDDLTSDTKHRLIEAAGPLFADKGVKQTTVREICERAGVRNIAAVNYHFGSKDGLYAEAIRNAFTCGLTRTGLPVPDADLPPRDQLQHFIAGMVRHMVGDLSEPWQTQLLLRELLEPSVPGQALVQDFIRPVNEVLWGILRRLLPKGIDERRLHLVGFSIAGQCLYHKVARAVVTQVVGPAEQAEYTPEVLAEHITAFSLAALGLDPSAGLHLPIGAGTGAAERGRL